LEIYSLSLASGLYVPHRFHSPSLFENNEKYHAHCTNYSIDDSFLQRAVSLIPKQAIFLIEDIDCAFPSREESDPDSPSSESHAGLGLDPMDYGFAMDMGMSGMVVGGKRETKSRSRVTLSGLLNVLDGVGSEEGKIFFATVCIFPFQVFPFALRRR
jgi:chaperone BCS1